MKSGMGSEGGGVSLPRPRISAMRSSAHFAAPGCLLFANSTMHLTSSSTVRASFRSFLNLSASRSSLERFWGILEASRGLPTRGAGADPTEASGGGAIGKSVMERRTAPTHRLSKRGWPRSARRLAIWMSVSPASMPTRINSLISFGILEGSRAIKRTCLALWQTCLIDKGKVGAYCWGHHDSGS